MVCLVEHIWSCGVGQPFMAVFDTLSQKQALHRLVAARRLLVSIALYPPVLSFVTPSHVPVQILISLAMFHVPIVDH